MEKSKKALISIIVVSSITTAISTSVILHKLSHDRLTNYYIQKKIQKFGDLASLMKQNSKGAPLTFPISENPIPVLIEGFSDHDKQDIIKAINRLDNISDNLNYTIINNENTNIKEYITIQSNPDLKDSRAFGTATFTIDDKNALITYPIRIDIDPRCSQIYDSNGVSLQSYVVKHELAHTLGFEDLTDEKYLNKSIMWHSINSGLEINDFTNFDEDNIKKIYDEYCVEVTPPTRLQFLPPKQKEKDEEKTM